MVLATVLNPPLHHSTLFLSPSHTWSTPTEMVGDGGGDKSILRACNEEMTSSMDEHVGCHVSEKDT